MVKQPVLLMILLMSILLLSGCGSSEDPSGTIVTNQVILEKATGKYQEMRHIVLKGTNQDIGAAIAKISREQYQAQSIPFPTIQDKLNRNSYIQQFFPYLAERQRGVESYYGWGSSDLNDSSALWYEIFPVNCSAVFFPKSVTSTGRSFMARDMDFYTVDINQFIGRKESPLLNKLFSRNFILETYPENGGYAAMVVGTFDLMNGAYDGFNEQGLVISGLVDQSLTSTKGGVVLDLTKLSVQSGLNYVQMVRLLLENAATIDEVDDLLTDLTVYFPLDGIHFLIGDRSGNSAILEFYIPIPGDPASKMTYTLIRQPSTTPAIMTNHSMRLYPDPSQYQDKYKKTESYNTFYRYMRLYEYLQASAFIKYTLDDGLYAMSLVYGYADDASEGAAAPFPVRTIWSVAMDIDDLSMKIKFYTADNTVQKQPILTDAYTFKLRR